MILAEDIKLEQMISWGHLLQKESLIKIYEMSIYNDLVPKTSNNILIIFESHHDHKKSRKIFLREK